MKTLDDRITLTISNAEMNVHEAGTYPYFIGRYPNEITIFAGNFFYNGVDTAITFDITDIVATDGFAISEDEFTNVTHSIENNVVNAYYVRVNWGNSDFLVSSTEYVAKVFNYPNKDLGGNDVFFQPTASFKISITQQGLNKFISHYPMYSTRDKQIANKCPFGLSLLFGMFATSAQTTISIDSYTQTTTINKLNGCYSFSLISSVANIADYGNITPTNDGVLMVNAYTAAILDVCPKRYYLFWMDRYGSFQCQGFSDYANYSETFERGEVSDYQNRRRNATIQVQGKWRINSGWIGEDMYPYYESIYTSPVLFLFDTEQNKRYTVLVSGDYEEKTYRNQKKMINIGLELQENKTQNMIY